MAFKNNSNNNRGRQPIRDINCFMGPLSGRLIVENAIDWLAN